MALDSGTRLGPYEILAPVGSGGMGEVYRARDTRLDRVVAIKVLPSATATPQALERFEREAKAIAALNHPGICAVYDVGTTPVPFLVMELLEGETLHQRLSRGSVDVPTLVETGLALADALASAHSKGIVHRDLKPANIAVTPRGPKILDFGLARMTEATDVAAMAPVTLATQAPLTDAGVAVGTTAYMSPEQLRGEVLDARTDLFSLGLVLYEMATGRRAFAGTTTAVTSSAILHDEPIAPRQVSPELPARLEQAILTLLEKDRDVRTQTAAELRAELTRLKRELGSVRPSDVGRQPARVSPEASVSAGTPIESTVAPPSSSDAQLIAGVMRRHRGKVMVIGAALALFVGAGFYFVMTGTGGAATSDASSALTIADLAVEPLTTTGTADQPAISPDGKYVAYVEHGASGDSLQIRQVTIPNPVEIVRPERGVFLRGLTFTPDGTFVTYVRQVGVQPADLWEIPFLGGTPPRPLLKGISGRAAFSPDGSQMAYVRNVSDSQTDLMVAGGDGRSSRVLATRQLPDRFWPFSLAWAPDAATIALFGARTADSSTGHVVFVDVKTGSMTTAGPRPTLPGTGLAWLDTRELILSTLDRPSAPMQLWLLSYPEGKFRRLTNDTTQYVSLSLTADRNALVTVRSESSFALWTSDTSLTGFRQVLPPTPAKGQVGFRVGWIGDDPIFVASTTGGFALTRWRSPTQTTEVVAQSGGNPSVSRDGSTIAFFDYDASELTKIDAAGTNRVRLSGAGGLSGISVAPLSPDGRHFVTVEAGGAKGPVLRLVSADGHGTSRDVTAHRVRPPSAVPSGGPALATAAEISPDGRRVAYTSVDERNQPVIAVCDLEACSPASTQMLPVVGTWHWMPDSRGLAYVDTRTQSDLWSQPLDGSAPRQLTRFEPDGRQIWDFSFSADGRLLVARASISNNIVLFSGLRPPK